MCSGFSLGAVQFFTSGLEVGLERGQGGGSVEAGWLHMGVNAYETC